MGVEGGEGSSMTSVLILVQLCKAAVSAINSDGNKALETLPSELINYFVIAIINNIQWIQTPLLYSGHFEKSQSMLFNTKSPHPSNKDTFTGPKGRPSVFAPWLRPHCFEKLNHTKGKGTL